MRYAICGLVALGLLGPSPGLASSGGFDDALDTARTATLKDGLLSGAASPVPQQGGEDISSAVPILSLPFQDTGNTCGYADDYDVSCPYAGGIAPDVVYRWTPAYDTSIDITLCASSYDTKVFVYESVAGNDVACNDDACGATTYQSELMYVPVTANTDYYIVIDGYGADCGDYILAISESMPCLAPSRGCDWAEGEPACADEYVDHFNGGCNSDPPVFSTVPCSADGGTPTICGVGGGFDMGGNSYRDTDWWEIDGALNDDGFTWCVTGQADMLIGYITVAPCDEITAFDESAIAVGCDPTCLTVPPGAYYLFVAVPGFGAGIGCHEYEMTIDGYDCGPVPVAVESWGGIKERYR